jgi:hypothetical protein
METSKPKLSVGIEYPQRRFGLIAIEKGFITVDDLWEAIVRQKAQDSAERRHIGMILKDLGHLTISQIDEVLEAMAKEGEPKKTFSGSPKKSVRGRRSRKTQKTAP